MGRILWYNIGSGNHALRLSESVGQGGGGTLKKWRKSLLLFCALLALLLLSACSPGRDMEEFMALPRLPQEYLELQKVLDALQSDGASIAAPVSGNYRQSVQFYDINGDGAEEALAFFRTPGERPLKIYIFIRNGSRYEAAAVVEGDGASIESVTYTDMDGDGWTELVVGWGMDAELKMLTVYSLKAFQVSPIANAGYTQYTVGDLDGDGRSELLLVRLGDGDKSGTAERIGVSRDGETVSASSRLSAGMESVSRLTCGALLDRKSALYVEGSVSGGLVTDVFLFEDDALKNITLGTQEISEGTFRSSSVALRDMNGDGVPEIPIPRALPAQGETVYRILDWYALNSRGVRRLQLSTYHNFSDSWYLILSEYWGDRITIRREDTDAGERAVVFSRWNGSDKPVTDFLVVYTISGANREELAARQGRLILYSGAEITYAARLLLTKEEWSLAPDEAQLRLNFGLIYSEWISGST